MNLYIQRGEYREDGIFSTCTDEQCKTVMCTLEHSYANLPKIPPGVYSCVRGPHRLHGMTEDFETFEVIGVVGHKGLLFHWGNFNRDSEGCILVGHSIQRQSDGTMMVAGSRAEFAAFMALQEGVDSFTLTVLA